MTQAPPDRLERLESTFERLTEVITAMDKKLDIHIARTDERFNTIDQRFNSLETQLLVFKAETDSKFSDLREDVKGIRAETDSKFSDLREDVKGIRSDVKGQDARLWGFVVALFLSLAGVIVKVVFFPQA